MIKKIHISIHEEKKSNHRFGITRRISPEQGDFLGVSLISMQWVVLKKDRRKKRRRQRLGGGGEEANEQERHRGWRSEESMAVRGVKVVVESRVLGAWMEWSLQ